MMEREGDFSATQDTILAFKGGKGVRCAPAEDFIVNYFR